MNAQFRLFGIPVSVGAYFLLTAVILGRRQAPTLALLVAWIAVMFVGVLMHELGHALTARAYGQQPSITLHGLGGLTSWRPPGDIGPGRRAVITLAGPLVGIVVGVPAAVLAALLPEASAARLIARFAAEVNLVWGLLNLLPMLPLDGGRIVASLLELAIGPGGQRAASALSIAVALALAGVSLWSGDIVLVLFCAFFVYLNVQALLASGRPGPGAPAAPPTGPGGTP